VGIVFIFEPGFGFQVSEGDQQGRNSVRFGDNEAVERGGEDHFAGEQLVDHCRIGLFDIDE
jgi:hypothetical protein